MAPAAAGQGLAPVAASRVALLQLPHHPALQLAALVQRGRRRLHGDVDGGRPGPRPGRLRRDGLSRHGAGRRALLRSAGPRLARGARQLPGGRQRLPLRHAILHLARLRVLAGEGGRVDPARRGQRALLLGQLPARLRRPARAGVAGLDRLRARVPAAEPGRGPQAPDHALHAPRGPRCGLGLADALRRGERDALRRLPVPGRRRSHRCAGHARRHGAAARGPEAGDALHRHLARVRPGRRDALLRERQHGLPRPHGPRREDRRGAHAVRGRAHRGARLQPRGPLAVGRAAVQRHRHPGAPAAPLYHLVQGLGVPLRARPLRPRHLARRAAALGIDGRGKRRPVPAGVGDRTAPLGRDQAAVRIPLRAIRSRELRLLARRALPVRQQLLHGRLQHLPLRGRHGRHAGGIQRRDRDSSAPGRWPTGACWCSPTPRRVSSPGRSSRAS